MSSTDSRPPELSVIIPVLNEVAALPRLLAELAQQQGIALEVLAADGGSSDGSAECARAAGARLVPGPRGRGKQMNAAALEARAEHLLFLHADSELPSPTLLRDALAALRAEQARNALPVVGHFALRFVRNRAGDDFFYRNLEEKTSCNRRDTINGDQGMLLRAEHFHELGRFDEQLPFLEDQRFAARVFDRGRWLTLPGLLRTSARRFESEGPYRRYTLISIIMGMHDSGVEGFFRRAPKVYAAQAETGRLLLGPYLALVRHQLIEAGPAGALRIIFRVGCYTRSNSWQLFFWWDVLLRRWLGPNRYPFLRFHDRVFHPLTAHVVGNAITAVAVSVWFLAVLPLACAVLDRAPAHPRAAS